MPQVKQNYIDTGKISYIYRPLVADIENDTDRLVAESIYCAGEQGKFWEMTDWLFANVDNWSTAEDIIVSLEEQAAPPLGLDGTELERCLRTERFRPQVEKIADDANARNIENTPTFLINGQPVEFSSYDQFASLIEEALKR